MLPFFSACDVHAEASKGRPLPFLATYPPPRLSKITGRTNGLEPKPFPKPHIPHSSAAPNGLESRRSFHMANHRHKNMGNRRNSSEGNSMGQDRVHGIGRGSAEHAVWELAPGNRERGGKSAELAAAGSRDCAKSGESVMAMVEVLEDSRR